MALESNVALVALVVSLIALIIALGQLSQQLLGTAEGYRRCGQQVLDPWHRLRWRDWIWSEFRYETHFVTPQLTIQAEKEVYEPNFRGQCLRDAADGQDKNGHMVLAPSSKFRTWRWWTRRSERDVEIQAPRILRATLLGSSEYEPNAQRESPTAASAHDAEKCVESTMTSGPSPRGQVSGVLLQSQNKASWIELLRRLHKVYYNYETRVQPVIRTSAIPASPHTSAKRLTALAADTDPQPDDTIAHLPSLRKTFKRPEDPRIRSSVNLQKTQVVVHFTEWIWDIMPDGVSKPLATTTMGAITIMALRMGMQWTVNTERRLAYGNGYSITFQEIPALGLVAKLNRSGGPDDDFPKLIPGRATDKLMCGIIPGSQYLVDQDFHCIGEGGDKTMKTICAALIDRDVRDLYEFLKSQKDGQATLFWGTQNEAVTLLCEYLPVPTSNSTLYYFWGFKPRRQGVFASWEASIRLHRELQKHKSDGKLTKVTAVVLEYLNYLETNYKNDFHGINGRRAKDGEDPGYGNEKEKKEKKQVQLLADCRDIFNETTAWFRDSKFDRLEDNDSDGADTRTVYMRLVAAHVYMSLHAVPEAKKARNETHHKERPITDDKKKDIYNLDEVPGPGHYFKSLLYHTADAYLDHLEHGKYGIVKQMEDILTDTRHDKINTKEDVIDAWWVMMLRGIIWSMPTTHTTKGEPVPSSLYENDTPVWIT